MMGIFMKQPIVTMETTNTHPEPQTLSSYDQKQMESTVQVKLDWQKRLSALGQLRTLRQPMGKGV